MNLRIIVFSLMLSPSSYSIPLHSPFKYNLKTYIHERWFPMMAGEKFVKSIRRHLFPILLLDFLLRSDLLISSESRPLLLAAKSWFVGYLFFLFRLFCQTVLFLVSDSWIFKGPSLHLLCWLRRLFLVEVLLSYHRGLKTDEFWWPRPLLSKIFNLGRL